MNQDIGSKIQKIAESLNEGRRPTNLRLTKQPVIKVDVESLELDQIKGRNRILKIDNEEHYTDIKDLEDLGELGNGTSGQVIKMRHRKTNQIIAVKQMRRTNNNEESKRIWNDLDVVLKSHDCPYIVHCLGYFITDADVWICMELMETCFDKLTKKFNQPVPENILGKVTVATVRALAYLKDVHGVIHRDVKPSNILVDMHGNIKLCDFGISGRLVDSKAKTRSAGCTAYMAPERIDPQKPMYDVRADIWSLGITLVELATGSFPYKGCNTDFEVLTCVLQKDAPRLPTNMGFSIQFQNFVSNCLKKNYEERPKYRDLLESDFIKFYENLPVDVATWLAEQIHSNANSQPNELGRQPIVVMETSPVNSSAPRTPTPSQPHPLPLSSTTTSTATCFTESDQSAQPSPAQCIAPSNLLESRPFFRPLEFNSRPHHIADDTFKQMGQRQIVKDFDARLFKAPPPTFAPLVFDSIADTLPPLVQQAPRLPHPPAEVLSSVGHSEQTQCHPPRFMNTNPFVAREMSAPPLGQYQAADVYSNGYHHGRAGGELDFHNMEYKYNDRQLNMITQRVNNMHIDQHFPAVDHGLPVLDSGDKRIHLRFDEQAYTDLHGKRLLSPFLQRKTSLPSHHQSRSTDRAAHGFHAFQGAPIARQSSSDRDTHRRFNASTNAHMASPRPKGSTSPIVLQRFHHQQSQLRDKEVTERTQPTQFRDNDPHGHYKYREPSHIVANAGINSRISSNPFHEYLVDRGASAAPFVDHARLEYSANETPKPHHDQFHLKHNESRSKYTVISNTNMDTSTTPATAKDRDEGWFNTLASMVKKGFASYIKSHAGESSKNGTPAPTRKPPKFQHGHKEHITRLPTTPASMPSSPNFSYRQPHGHINDCGRDVFHRMSPMIERRHQSPDPPPRFNKGQSPLILRRKLELDYKYVSPIPSRRIIPSSPLPPPRKLAGPSTDSTLPESSCIFDRRTYRIVNNND